MPVIKNPEATFLNRRIQNAAAQGVSPKPTIRLFQTPAWQATAAALVMALIGFGVLQLSNSPVPGVTPPVKVGKSNPLALLSLDQTPTVGQLGGLVESPLQQEMEGLRKNAQSAIRFVINSLGDSLPTVKTPATASNPSQLGT
jgi:hypothetical protein